MCESAVRNADRDICVTVVQFGDILVHDCSGCTFAPNDSNLITMAGVDAEDTGVLFQLSFEDLISGTK